MTTPAAAAPAPATALPASTVSLVSTIRLPESSALSIAQTAKYVFAGLPSGSIGVWRTSNLQHQRDLQGHTGSVLALQTVTDLKKTWLVSASADSTVRVWDANTCKPLWQIFPPTDGFGDIFSVAHSGNRIVFGTQSCALLWVDLPSCALDTPGTRTPPPAGRYNKFFDSQAALDLSRAQASAHGRLYSSLNELSLVTSRSSTSSEVHPTGEHKSEEISYATVDHEDVVLNAHYGYIYALTFASLGEQTILISGSGDGSIHMWLSTPRGLQFHHRLLEDQEEGVLALEVKDSTTLCASFQGGKIRIFDLATLTMLRTLSAGTEDVLSLARVGDACASTCADGSLQIWNRSFSLESSRSVHEGIALSCSASPDGQFIYTGGNDGTLKVWYRNSTQQALAQQSEALQGRLFTLLAEFVRYKSVSSDESCREECRQTAIWLKDTLATLNADTSLLPTVQGRNPIVLAKFVPREPKTPAPQRKRVLFYGHYDVVSDQGVWASGNAFKLTGMNGKLYGRGVIDNKGPILAVATAAADLLEAGQLDIDLLMLLEGEEETDSAGMQDACRKHAAEIGRIDAVLVSNSYSLGEDLPSIMWGLRGRLNLTVSVTSSGPDLHSGQYGGITSEPLIGLTQLLGSLLDPRTGRVAVPGFYDQVRPMDESEERVYDEIIDRCSDENLSVITRNSRFPDPKTSIIQSWREPSLSIHRINVSGSSISTVIPAEAKATISVRTVPDMPLKSTAAAVIKHLEDTFSKSIAATTGNTLKVTLDSAAPWWIADRNHPFGVAAENAIYDEWKVQPLWIREGGSLPSLPFLEQLFSASVVHLPMGVQGDCAHLVDEHSSYTSLQRGYRVVQNWMKALPSAA